MKTRIISILLPLIWIFLISPVNAQSETSSNPELDKKVEAFLKDSQGEWRDMNVPVSDGKLLYDLIIKNNYTHALEIGTSTGHSGISPGPLAKLAVS
jgi:predicted O-methyltransferase YrrM